MTAYLSKAREHVEGQTGKTWRLGYVWDHQQSGLGSVYLFASPSCLGLSLSLVVSLPLCMSIPVSCLPPSVSSSLLLSQSLSLVLCLPLSGLLLSVSLSLLLSVTYVCSLCRNTLRTCISSTKTHLRTVTVYPPLKHTYV